ncbi:iron-containing alcohol dehydrogenase [Thermosyntropha sp.]|uniref:iron-containing alcohol dehydrogenase n=1 Tax=Thermosyntropha sp. TaxID=2740820 RepID=UPI0025E2045D|nr:iron-containing alcohol dehydrogenase [Thermosyntropha sp.]MBO8158162.1 iron-containing alcohol dehydrogenase [Thermosyntropha sp.]
MLDFVFHNPTKIIFGKGKISKLGEEIVPYSRRILLVYGEGSIKRNGIYYQVVDILKESGIEYKELSGVKPNPRLDSVREGIKLCREHSLDMVLAVGGGSVIDCAKIIAAGFFYDGDPWDFFTRKAKIEKALPIGAVLTLAATGSEMNGNAVISNDETKAKKGVGSSHLLPKFSILDPLLTCTVPPLQTAAGVADIMSHVFEQYFSANEGAYLQDRIAESVLKTCIHYAPIALKEPENYEARANLMWASTIALNGILSTGKLTDWATHMIEHEVSALYDIAHGVGLAILIPYWMEYVLDEQTVGKFAAYAINVWGVTGNNEWEMAKEGIGKTRAFFKALGLPSRLNEVGIQREDLEIMAEKAVTDEELGRFKKLNRQDVLSILKNAF